MRAVIDLPSGVGCQGTIAIDGQQIQRGVRGFAIRSSVDAVTNLELDVIVLDGVEFNGEVRVTIPEKTAETLIAIGWTPPPSQLNA